MLRIGQLYAKIALWVDLSSFFLSAGVDVSSFELEGVSLQVAHTSMSAPENLFRISWKTQTQWLEVHCL